METNLGDINFGLGWDAQSLIEKEMPKLKEEKKERITVAQKRQLILEEISTAILNSNKDDLIKLIEEDNILTKSQFKHTIINLLMDNFDPDIANIVLDNGFSIEPHILISKIFDKKSFDMLKFFVGRANLPENKKIAKQHNMSKHAHQTNKKGFNYEANFEYDEFIKLMFLKFFYQNKYDHFSKKCINYLADNVEGMIDYVFNTNSNDLFFEFFRKCPVQDSGWHKSMLARVSAQTWESMFDTYFKYQTKSRFNFNIENFIFLTQYLKEDSTARKSWNKIQKKKRDEYNHWKSWWDKYVPQDIPLKDSHLIDVLSNMSYTKTDCSFLPESIKHVNKDEVGRKLADLIISLMESQMQSSNLKDCLTSAQYLRLFNFYNTPWNIDFVNNLKDEKNPENNFKSKPPHYTSPTFIHSLVDNASPLLLSIVKTKDGRDAIEKCFEDEYSKFLFIANTNIDTLIPMLKKIPSLKDFKDNKGSNVAQILLSKSSFLNKTQALDLLRIFKEDFARKNDYGVSLFDIVKTSLQDKEFDAMLEAQMIKRSLIAQGVSEVRLTKSKNPSRPRKM